LSMNLGCFVFKRLGATIPPFSTLRAVFPEWDVCQRIDALHALHATGRTCRQID